MLDGLGGADGDGGLAGDQYGCGVVGGVGVAEDGVEGLVDVAHVGAEAAGELGGAHADEVDLRVGDHGRVGGEA